MGSMLASSVSLTKDFKFGSHCFSDCVVDLQQKCLPLSCEKTKQNMLNKQQSICRTEPMKFWFLTLLNNFCDVIKFMKYFINVRTTIKCLLQSNQQSPCT